VTLVFEGEEVPKAGTKVMKDEAAIGDVRSAESTPRFGVIALAVVQTEFAVEGESLAVGDRIAIVRGLPIDDPKKERPRSDPRSPVTVD
jgi:glycine cleavage system aminomethyltransferase T